MATTQVVKVKVEELSKFGFKANGRYVGLSKQLPEADKTRLVPGAEFEAEYYVADSGKEYLNKILVAAPGNAQGPTLSVTPTPDLPLKKQVDAERAKKFTPKFNKTEKASDSSMSKDEWAAKDRRISRQGCIQAAVQALAPVISVDLLESEAVKLADSMLRYVNEK